MLFLLSFFLFSSSSLFPFFLFFFLFFSFFFFLFCSPIECHTDLRLIFAANDGSETLIPIVTIDCGILLPKHGVLRTVGSGTTLPHKSGHWSHGVGSRRSAHAGSTALLGQTEEDLAMQNGAMYSAILEEKKMTDLGGKKQTNYKVLTI